ncbi:hypothetical protein ACQKNB_04400 [Lysinibacillus xylanilyticus]|uniref:hypothetical protein n=1 Tax=Lysinibacillus xylanilyticus TaxID=582475 RepID=UPI003D05F1B6
MSCVCSSIRRPGPSFRRFVSFIRHPGPSFRRLGSFIRRHDPSFRHFALLSNGLKKAV